MYKSDLTVGIPFYDRTVPEEFILAVDSIINQTIKPYEIHLIQDGVVNSKLNQIVIGYLKKNSFIKHIKLEKSNLATALNHSIKLTKSKYYARMDSDDISMPNRLEIQYDFL